jgi:hypothetical protein
MVEPKDVGVDNFEVLAGFNVHDVITGDTDGDGMDDFKENFFFSDLSKDGSGDQDGDGLADIQELTLRTDPTVTDSDADGLSDGEEVNEQNTDPANADSDGDSLTDGEETNDLGTDPNKTDTDDDTFDDQVEVALGNDPVDAANKPDAIVAVSSGSWNDGATWSDGLAPTAGKQYVAVGNITSRLLSAAGAFAGDSLTLIGPGVTLELAHTGEASAIIVAKNANLNVRSSLGLGGTLDIRGAVMINVGEHDLALNSQLKGVGDLTLQGGSEIEFKGNIALSGTGTTFAGPLNVIGTDVAGLIEGSLGTGTILTASGGIEFGYDYDSPAAVIKIQGQDFRLNIGGEVIVSDIVGVDLSGSVIFSLFELAGPGPYDADLLLGAFQLEEGITGDGSITLRGSEADTDSDGLLDTWEQENFANLDATPDGDPDGDGATNLEEQSVGTDPNAADAPPTNGEGPTVGGDDRPVIGTIIKASAGGPINLGFPEGTAFDVEYSTDLQTWSVIASGVSGPYKDSDAGRTSAQGGYYRGLAN